MDGRQATALLDQYCFEKHSAFNEMSLALHLEQNDCFPDWADRYKRPINAAEKTATEKTTVEKIAADPGSAPPGAAASLPAAESSLRRCVDDITSAGPSAPKRKKENAPDNVGLSLGEEFDSGFYGTIYADKYDRNFLIKVLRRDQPMALDDPRRLTGRYPSEDAFEVIPVDQRRDNALREAALFCRYYGEGTAFAYSDGTDVYIRMLRIAGTPLSCVKVLPRDAVQRYVDMMEKLNSVGIMHADLHSDNVLFDAVTDQFKPIDFSDRSAAYFSASAAEKELLNQGDESRWNAVMEQIGRKMISKRPRARLKK